ncbi:hypothetical protein CRE_03342 [Caenorhabditis remanei]|uniref:Uncharacterized protein n=1 Tax=Caenorhabditis remanei TaxID=31234 RepID=E3MYK8_CAERE|nr:hypothetical protein CRE_03342 [Caenorhabditis remanei]
METIPLGLLVELLKSFHWALPNNISLESIIESELQFRQQLLLLQQNPQLSPMTVLPSPTVTPESVVTSSPVSAVDEVIDVVKVQPVELVEPEPEAEKEKEKTTKKRERRSPVSPSKTYSDCEKKHFLDVAYENNWGTTVAANKFTRIWGKGPTRRMFYWWREQFKRDNDRDHKTLSVLKDRKTELSLELTQFVQNQEQLKIKSQADRAKACLHQLEAVDSEIESFLGKKQKSMCSITGEKCVHGDGIQEENNAIKKFTNSFVCDFCKMPFQKESTCFLHQKLCESRFINPIQLTASDLAKTSERIVVQKLDEPSTVPPPQATVIQLTPPTYESYNTELTELAEQLIARLAACAAGQTTVISN